MRRYLTMGLAVTCLSWAIAADAQGVDKAAEAPFIAENTRVMDRMMSGMDISASGDVDRDFTVMMIPHHQGAIDMAVLELKYGHNEQLKRIAQEIIVDQQQEIAAMNLAIGAPLPVSKPAPTQPTPAPSNVSGMDMPRMKTN